MLTTVKPLTLRSQAKRSCALMKRISLMEASKRLGMSVKNLKKALIQNKLPIGISIRHEENMSRMYSFYVYEELLTAYEGGELQCICKDCILKEIPKRSEEPKGD